jgi:hypothetical protein
MTSSARRREEQMGVNQNGKGLHDTELGRGYGRWKTMLAQRCGGAERMRKQGGLFLALG